MAARNFARLPRRTHLEKEVYCEEEPLVRHKTGKGSAKGESKADKIRNKYKLPQRNDRYNKWKVEQNKVTTDPTQTFIATGYGPVSIFDIHNYNTSCVMTLLF